MIRFSRRQALWSGLGLSATAVIAPGAENPQSDSKAKSLASQNESKFTSRFERANSLPEIEALARDSMLKSIYELVSGGGAGEVTLRWNRGALDRIRLQPRVLVDVSKLDTRIKLLGHELPFPILLAPTGEHGLIHPEGELATVRGAGASAAV